ncbi:hypothetical protein BC332_21425 [Capsicum chinense]|nr:hypothetical protein BC332_21425 [Capsicum chinense]
MTYVLGSVYGLFLLKKVVDGNLSLSLWNPALREVRHLPNPKFEVQPCTTNPPRPFIWQFGLGLDPVTNDYKDFGADSSGIDGVGVVVLVGAGAGRGDGYDDGGLAVVIVVEATAASRRRG